jgi:glucose-6-phosphate isomerase
VSKRRPYEISFSLALQGKGAPQRAAFDGALSDAKSHLKELIEASDRLELLTILDHSDDFMEAWKLADVFTADTSEIFILGIGGSSLGGRALSKLLPKLDKQSPRVTFVDNLGAETFGAALDECDVNTTQFLAISKSGCTAETLMQTLLAAAAVRKSLGGDKLAEHFVVVTENRPNALRSFAQEIGCPIFNHPLEIGGRYSVLSIVGLLPAALMGLNPKAVRAGAKSVIENARANPGGEESPAAGAALHFALLREGRLRESVLWTYVDRLETFGDWWRQLWAESLGKGGQGITPIAALGPVDQHSQLQLYLDGPGDALFTLVILENSSAGPKVPAEDAEKLGLSFLGGKALGDLLNAEARATADTLARRGRPVRLIRLEKVDEYTLGALFMHFMLETIIMGRLMGVDPFDQPAVEEGKKLTREYLEGR